MLNARNTLYLLLISPLLLFPGDFAVFGQSRNVGQLEVRVFIKELGQDHAVVQNLDLTIQKLSDDSTSVVSSIQTRTTATGTASLALLPGYYVVKSARALLLDEKAYDWSVKILVEPGKPTSVELTHDNATITNAAAAIKEGRITDETDLLSVLGRGVVTVQGEVEHGSGLIVDRRGLILANEHTIRKSKELRIQFDEGLKVEAKLLRIDSDKGLALLWANLDSCSRCRELVLRAERHSEKGERVFSISSTLSNRSLSSGVILSADQNVIVPDFIPANPGSALFNMRGEVIGVSGLDARASARGEVPRAISVEEARKVLAEVATSLQEPASSPRSNLLPVEPEPVNPTDTLKGKVDLKRFSKKPYRVDVGKYKVTMITPTLKQYIIEKDRYEHERREAKLKLGPSERRPHRAVSSFYNLRSWAEYVSQIRPVVHMLAIPEVRATGKSLFFSLLGASVGVFTPLDFKFKADFEEMVLMCDGYPVQPVHRGKIEYVEPLQNYYRTTIRTAYAGIYTYTPEAFEPGRCKQLELQIYSEANPNVPDKKMVGTITMQRVWSDLQSYRNTPGRQ